MISKILYAIQSGLAYCKENPPLQFAFLLVVVLPLIFLYSSNQFLEAGRSNQDKLQRDRVGLLHDSFVAILRGTNYEAARAQAEIEQIVSLNPDLTKFRIVQQTDTEFIIVAAANTELIAASEEVVTLYQTAAVRFDESLIFPFERDGDRFWQSIRAFQSESGDFYYILTETSFAAVDGYLASKEKGAYLALFFTYLIILGIAYWQIRLTNYRDLYKKTADAVATKDMFTNMIAHELRAPLTAMRGYASMIHEADTSETDRIQYSGRIKGASERLLTIVNDLLDVARIQSGKLQIALAPHDVAQTITAVVEELQVSAEAKHIALEVELPPVLPEIATDEKRMHQILTNITSNAIKYTPEGTIVIAAAEYKGGIEIRVKDTGMGISAEDQKQLFAPFFRVDSTDVSTITGTGLGMWITRQLTELIGGSIAVESIKGVGTHVVVRLPHKNG